MLKWINAVWYKKNIFSYFLFPLSLLYLSIIFIRRTLYKRNLFKTHRVSVPVIIVGNITVGGTGKTPLVIALVEALKKNGFHPGIITRGYGGKSKTWPQYVDENSDPFLVGDEAVLIARKTGVPVVAGPSRVDSVNKLIDMCSQRIVETRVERCTQRVTSVPNVIISDDGLQHYALERDIEIAVIDASRHFGNGLCLPAGPLREPKNRLNSVDFIVVNGSESASDHVPSYFTMQFVIDDIVNIQDKTKKLTAFEKCNTEARALARAQKIIAIAAIGNPDRFFTSLRALNIAFETRIFPDHYFFQAKDFADLSCDIILMTEKDAVKCAAFADDRLYKVCGQAKVDEALIAAIVPLLRSRATPNVNAIYT